MTCHLTCRAKFGFHRTNSSGLAFRMQFQMNALYQPMLTHGEDIPTDWIWMAVFLVERRLSRNSPAAITTRGNSICEKVYRKLLSDVESPPH